jgi:Reverse transcriptase (RNA-dependent DNA polymerase)
MAISTMCIFIDEFTRFSWFYTCASKSDIINIFTEFKTKAENLLSCTIKKVQCDGGLEFKPLQTKFPAIHFQLSCPYTPEQNGLAKRKHRHLVELSLATMYHAGIPLSYWDWIFSSVNFVINRLPSTHTTPVSPFQKLFQQKLDYDFLHTIGCACFPLLRPYTEHKLQPRSEECVFMGYSQQHKGYRCLHLPTQKVFISRHVIFNETQFPFKNVSEPSLSPLQPLPSHSLTILPSSHPSPSFPGTSTPPPSLTSSTHYMQTRHKTNSLKPRLFPNHQVYTTAVTSTEVEPTGYTSAAKFPHWRQAMASELTALALNSTWDLVPLPANAHAIGCKWLFKIKKKADGSIARYKARLVAKGYTQEEGFDYFDTFSPVIKPTTVRIVITIALSNHRDLHQLDVNNAFLHGDLQETVYMMQPPGFVDSLHPSYVCKLKKTLYGLKQAPRAWFHKLKQFLLSHNFLSSQSDHSLFIHSSPDCVLYTLVYVDDIIITGNNKTAIQSLISSLDAQFSL